MSNYFISYGIDILIFLGVFYWFRILNHDYKSIIFMSIIYLVINVGFKIQFNDLGLKSNTLLFSNLLTMTILFISSLLLSVFISTDRYKAILLAFVILFIGDTLEFSLSYIRLWYIDLNKVFTNLFLFLVIPIIILLDKLNYLSFSKKEVVINVIFIIVLTIVRIYCINNLIYKNNGLAINIFLFILWIVIDKLLIYQKNKKYMI